MLRKVVVALLLLSLVSSASVAQESDIPVEITQDGEAEPIQVDGEPRGTLNLSEGEVYRFEVNTSDPIIFTTNGSMSADADDPFAPENMTLQNNSSFTSLEDGFFDGEVVWTIDYGDHPDRIYYKSTDYEDLGGAMNIQDQAPPSPNPTGPLPVFIGNWGSIPYWLLGASSLSAGIFGFVVYQQRSEIREWIE